MTGPELATGADWQRLDPRMLLVHPIRELVRFLPVLVGVFVAGTAAGGWPWELVGVAFPVGLGLLRYLTTSFRVSQGRIELRRGLLSRHVLSASLDRVRTVDLTASPVHRVLDLVTVRIGTGTGSDDDLDLDGLRVARARRFREELLRLAAPEAAEGAEAPASAGARAPVVLELDPGWVRFAPFTATGFVAAAALLGAVPPLLEMVGGVRVDAGDLPMTGSGAGPWVVGPALGLGVLLVVATLAMSGYLVTNWGFTLTRDGGAWHVSRGLLTTRETTLDEGRVAGVSLGEPLGLRLVGGARLTAIATGLDRAQQGSSHLAPPAPRAVVADAAAQVLRTSAPIEEPLASHGRAAIRRRWIRGVGPALVVALVGVALVAADAAPAWILVPILVVVAVAAGLAADRARTLGHRLVDGHLVARSGSLLCQRDVLGADHVIGWTFRDTWFQRRVGLLTLVATTAGGRQAVAVLDVPADDAVWLADAAVPGLVGQFR